MSSPQLSATQDLQPADFPDDVSAFLAEVKAEIARVFIGRPEVIDLMLTAVLAGGHMLIEDAPGSGKTAISRALALCLGLDFQRIQCTNDLLPADIVGMSVFDRKKSSFTFRQGPVFTQMLLADELNRAPSRTQSSLLEAMEEKRVTVDRTTMDLPQPFLVVATQNPKESIGTFDLPESQLDRFAISMAIGRPEKEIQRHILAGMAAGSSTDDVRLMANAEIVLSLQEKITATHIHDDILDYIIALADMVEAEGFVQLSVRYRNQLTKLAQASAVLAGRDFVAPDDVQAMLAPSLRHRLPPSQHHVIEQVLAQVALP